MLPAIQYSQPQIFVIVVLFILLSSYFRCLAIRLMEDKRKIMLWLPVQGSDVLTLPRWVEEPGEEKSEGKRVVVEITHVSK